MGRVSRRSWGTCALAAFGLAFAIPFAGDRIADLKASAEEIEAERQLPAEAAETPTAEASAEGADGHCGRIASNFAALMGAKWAEVPAAAGWVVLHAAVWCICAGLLGGIVGLLAYLRLRKHALFGAPWGWYRFLRWAWSLVFVLCVGLGLAYAGLWYGGGRKAKSYVRDERVLDRIAIHLICAACLDKADYRVNGQETVEQLDGVLAKHEKVGALVQADLARGLAAFEEDGASAVPRGWLTRLAAEALSGDVLEKLKDLDSCAIMRAFLDNPDVEAYLRDHPDAHPAVMAVSGALRLAREKACATLDGTVYPHAGLGVGLGFGVPLALLAIFRFVVWLWGRWRRPAAGAPPPASA